MYNTFLRLYPDGFEQIQVEKKKSSFLTNFYFTEHLIIVLLALACIVNMINEFLVFCAIYGWIFLIAVFIKLSKKAYDLRIPG
jgi:hypothetical protein